MICPSCKSPNVTSAVGKRGTWVCMQPVCGREFNRDAQANRLGIK